MAGSWELVFGRETATLLLPCSHLLVAIFRSRILVYMYAYEYTYTYKHTYFIGIYVYSFSLSLLYNVLI